MRNRKQQKSVGEHDVEMHGGPEEEMIEIGWDDDKQGEHEDHEAGRRKVKELHDPKLPSETERFALLVTMHLALVPFRFCLVRLASPRRRHKAQ